MRKAGSNNRRIHFTALASLLTRAIMIATSFVTTPLLIKYLGQQQYGYWLTIISTANLLAFADLGIGSTLINEIASFQAIGDTLRARQVISNAFIALCSVVSFLAISSCVVYYALTREIIGSLSTSTTAIEAYGPTLMLAIGAWLITIPLSVVQRVQQAEQKGYISQMWQAAGAILSLGSLWFCTLTHQTILVLIFCFCASQPIALIFNWAFYFLNEGRHLHPRLADWRLSFATQMLRGSFTFFILQISGIVVFSLDSLIIAHFFGPTEVTQYNLVYRLFQIPNIVFSMWFAAMWPSYAQAIARGEMIWVRKTLKETTLLTTFLTIATCIGLSRVITPLIEIWTHVHLEPSRSLLAAFSCNAALVVGLSSVTVYLHASRFLIGHAMLASIHAFVSLALALTLPHFLGPEGVAWSTATGFSLVILPAFIWLVPRMLRQQEQPPLPQS